MGISQRSTILSLRNFVIVSFLFLASTGNTLAMTKVSAMKVSGSFDIPKKEYKVGETVRGKFTFLNQERDMTVAIRRWNAAGKLILTKGSTKIKKGDRLMVPVEWKVGKFGKQMLQYSVDGTWPSGKGLSGFSETFNYSIQTKQKQVASDAGGCVPFEPYSGYHTCLMSKSPHADPGMLNDEVSKDEARDDNAFTGELSPTTAPRNLGSILDCKKDQQCLLKYSQTFDEYLDACKPATGVTYIGLEVAFGFARNFAIQGISNSKCVIKFSLATSPDPSFLGKEMVCRLDPGKYAEQIGGLKQCTGPLSEALRNWNPPAE